MKKTALSWWESLSIKVKWDLFFKYNPMIAEAPANIGLNINDIVELHIIEIWCKENNIDEKNIDHVQILQNIPKW